LEIHYCGERDADPQIDRARDQQIACPDPSGKQTLHWDSELKGFGVLCSGTTTSRTYIVQRTLPDGRNRRVTIGSVAELDLDKRPASVTLYRQVVEKTLTSWLDRPLREITGDEIEDRHREIAAAIAKGGQSDELIE
jgi:hypothetical protein